MHLRMLVRILLTFSSVTVVVILSDPDDPYPSLKKEGNIWFRKVKSACHFNGKIPIEYNSIFKKRNLHSSLIHNQTKVVHVILVMTGHFKLRQYSLYPKLSLYPEYPLYPKYPLYPDYSLKSWVSSYNL